MDFIEVSVDDNSFREGITYAMNNFQLMVQTMIDVGYLIQANTYMLVPLDTGRLEGSFRVDVLEKNNDYVVVEAIYDAEDPDNGFHYAEIQHETLSFNHPKRGQALYLREGIYSSRQMAMSMIKTDFLSLFSGVK